MITNDNDKQEIKKLKYLSNKLENTKIIYSSKKQTILFSKYSNLFFSLK